MFGSVQNTSLKMVRISICMSEAYSEPKLECCEEKTPFSREPFPQNTPSYMYDKFLNTPLYVVFPYVFHQITSDAGRW